MSHIAISQRRARPREKGSLLTRLLDRCISLLPFLRLPGYFPMPPWDVVDPRSEKPHAEAAPAHAEKPPTEDFHR